MTWEESMVRVEWIWYHLESHWDIYNDQLGWQVFYALEKAGKTIPEYVPLDLVRAGLLLEGWTEEQVK